MSTISRQHRKWQHFIKSIQTLLSVAGRASTAAKHIIPHWIKTADLSPKILPSHSATTTKFTKCKAPRYNFYFPIPFFSGFHSFSLLKNLSVSTVSGPSCSPLVKHAAHYLHIPQKGVGRCRAWWLKNALSLHCLHSYAWFLLAWGLFIQLQKRPLIAYRGDTRPGPTTLCLLMTQKPTMHCMLKTYWN